MKGRSPLDAGPPFEARHLPGVENRRGSERPLAAMQAGASQNLLHLAMWSRIRSTRPGVPEVGLVGWLDQGILAWAATEARPEAAHVALVLARCQVS